MINLSWTEALVSLLRRFDPTIGFLLGREIGRNEIITSGIALSFEDSKFQRLVTKVTMQFLEEDLGFLYNLKRFNYGSQGKSVIRNTKLKEIGNDSLKMII